METLDYNILERHINDIETIDDVKEVLCILLDFMYRVDGASKEGEIEQ